MIAFFLYILGFFFFLFKRNDNILFKGVFSLKKWIASFLSIALLLSFTTQVFANETEKIPIIEAESAILINADTNEILFEKNPDTKLPPASLTKMMTLTIASEMIKENKLKHSDIVKISEKAWQTGGSRMFLEVGTEYPVEDILKGIAIVSGNDAAVALSEHISGSTDVFISLMNQKAKELDMNNTMFKTVHGLPSADDGDVTTARDLSNLASYYVKSFPKNLDFHSLESYTTKTRTHDIPQPNTNPLLGEYDGVDGLKTGFIDNHYNFIVTAKRDNLRLIAVILKSPTDASRKEDAKKLLDYGFSQYEFISKGKKGDVVKTLKVYQSKDSTITETNIVLKDNADFLAKKSDIETMKVEYELPDYLKAGLKKGDTVGQMIIHIGDKTYKKDLIVDQDIEKGGIWKSFIDWVVMKLVNISNLIFG